MEKKRAEEKEAKEARKRKRAQLREIDRLDKLKNAILKEVIKESSQEDFATKMQVYDVRDNEATNDGIVLIGGLVGELIISFTCLYEYISATPEHSNFRFTPDTVEKFLREVLTAEANAFPAHVVRIFTNKSVDEIKGEVEEAVVDNAVAMLTNPANIGSYGLRFLLEWKKDLFLPDDIVKVIIEAICRVALGAEKAALDKLPEGHEADDADEALKEMNDKITADNALLKAAQTKMAVKPYEGPSIDEPNPKEEAFVRLNNVREPVFDADGNPRGQGDGEVNLDDFAADKLPPKIPVVKTKLSSGAQIALYHAEAAFLMRRFLIEQAKKQFPELEKAETAAILEFSYHHKYKLIEERFEEELMKEPEYNLGCQHNDINQRITYKTFLDGTEE